MYHTMITLKIEIEKNYKENVRDRALVNATIAQLYLELADEEIDEQKKNSIRSKAKIYITRAMRLDSESASTASLCGCIDLNLGYFDAAGKHFGDAISKEEKEREMKASRGNSNEGSSKLRTVFPAIGKAVALLRAGNEEVVRGDKDKARTHFKSSLALFRHVLKCHPGCPTCVRFGIGFCLSRLGEYKTAKLAFKRVLQLEPKNQHALTALIVLEMGDWNHSEASANRIAKALNTMNDINASQEPDPYLLIQYARYFAIDGDYEVSKRLAQNLILYSENLEIDTKEKVKALARLVEARCLHIETDLADSKEGSAYTVLQKYQQSEIVGKSGQVLPLSILGTAQMHARVHNFKEAAREIEKILPSGNTDTNSSAISSGTVLEDPIVMWLAGSVSLKNDDPMKAASYLKAAERYMSKEAGIQIDIGQALQIDDPHTALEAYEKALSLLSDSSHYPVELLNNAAVLTMNLHSDNTEKLERAFELLEKAKETLSSDSYSKRIEKSISRNDGKILPVTIQFNTARLMEKRGKVEEAEALYRDLLESYPSYTDARLRLSQMEADKKNFQEAMSQLDVALKKCRNEEKGKIYCFMGNLHLTQVGKSADRLREAKTAYMQAIDLMKEEGGKTFDHGAYANLALANIYLESGRKSKKRKHEDERENTSEKNLDNALAIFSRSLRKNNRNIWAANGIGCVLAEYNAFKEAKQIFMEVQDVALADGIKIPDVEINLAHSYLHEGQHARAIQIYSNVNKNYYSNSNVQLLTLCGRAYYENEEYTECKSVLERAFALAPDEMLPKFHYGVLMQKIGQKGIDEARNLDDLRQYPTMEQAVKDAKSALEVFESIYDLEAAISLRTHIEQHINFLKNIITVSSDFLKLVKPKYEAAVESAKALRLEQTAKRKRMEELEADKRQKQEIERIKRREEEDAVRKEMEEKLSNLIPVLTRTVVEVPSGARPKDQDDEELEPEMEPEVVNEDDVGNNIGDAEEDLKKLDRSAKIKYAVLEDEDEDDEEVNEDKDEEKDDPTLNMEDDSTEDKEGIKNENGFSNNENNKEKMRTLFGSDEEEDEDEEG